MKKIKSENIKTDVGTTIVWIALCAFLWIVGLNLMFEVGITIGSDITLFLSTGIAAYFVGKATSDMQKKSELKANKPIKTTLGLNPKLARAILGISLTIIYGWFLLKGFLDTNTFTLLIDKPIDNPELGIISTLFWGVVGYYIPEFYNYFKKSD